MSVILDALGPPAHLNAPPAAADVVVIGGGVVGVSTAWALAKAGLSVVLVEKGQIAAEQSSRNWGWIRVQGRDEVEIKIMQHAQDLWRDMAAGLDCDIGLRVAGTWYVSDSARKIAGYRAWLEMAKGYGVSSRMVEGAAIADGFTGLRARWRAALHTPTDLRAEPLLAVPAMARAAVKAGVTICEGCAARRLDLAGGVLRGVVTEKGMIKASRVVVAGGAWSRLFLATHGVHLPQLSVRSSAMATDDLPDLGEGGVYAPGFAFRRRMDGGYTVAAAGFQELFAGPDAFRSARAFAPQLWRDPLGTKLRWPVPADYPDAWRGRRRIDAHNVSPFERMRVLDPTPHGRALETALARFDAAFEGGAGVQMRQCWAGMIDVLPDALPVVDQSAVIKGLTIATGFSGHGFGSGPVYGQIAADLVRGQGPAFDLAPFSLARFG